MLRRYVPSKEKGTSFCQRQIRQDFFIQARVDQRTVATNKKEVENLRSTPLADEDSFIQRGSAADDRWPTRNDSEAAG
jgi:hypothetical protein